MLERGGESWDIHLVGGADLASASRRAVRAGAVAGDLVLNNTAPPVVLREGAEDEAVSVIRTGSGDLELIAARDYRQDSAFAVYTAGGALPADEVPGVGRPDGGDLDGYDSYESSAAVTEVQADFLTGGGDVLVSAGRDLIGHSSGDLPTS
ncbi:MAG TPA: hypothetical protein DCQ09_01515, partial [Alcanivorax sp.]|nr:hypothetical protein [Alcanivorax sp.]